MYKVFIVDDEMVVRVGLKSFVDWESLGYLFAGEAGNGEDALVACKEIKPDVVLVDLKMPKMDGMEFIKALLLEQPDVKIVILSCVDEFDILQQALRLGIKDYFLKLSFSPEQLAKILKKLKNELDLQSKNQIAAIEKLESLKDVAIARENFFKNLIAVQTDKIPPSSDSQISINSETCKNAFILLISKDLRFEDPAAKVLGSSSRKFTIINLISEILSKDFKCDVMEIKTDIFMAICGSDEEIDFKMVYGNVNEIQNSLLRIMNYSVSIAVNLSCNCCENFYHAYQQCTRALQQKFYEGHKSIIFYDGERDSAEENKNFTPPRDIESKVQHELEYFEFDKAKQIVLDIIDQTAKDRSWAPANFKKYFPEIINSWYRMYRHLNPDFTAGADISNPYLHMEYLDTIGDLRQWFLEYVNSIEILVREWIKTSKVKTEIELAKKYIEDNYNKNININHVAGLVGYNSSYFSHLFKKETGEGFSDYLSRVRLNNAFKLLRETSYNIYQISEMVGYNDVAYFRKQFTHFHHKSPSKCRESE